jgi:hypothetical protein
MKLWWTSNIMEFKCFNTLFPSSWWQFNPRKVTGIHKHLLSHYVYLMNRNTCLNTWYFVKYVLHYGPVNVWNLQGTLLSPVSQTELLSSLSRSVRVNLQRAPNAWCRMESLALWAWKHRCFVSTLELNRKTTVAHINKSSTCQTPVWWRNTEKNCVVFCIKIIVADSIVFPSVSIAS